mmetsp:Transcript_22932/g.58557  ORF Transcript_22932/g.58557 Transcript_22932/m.58557 type:complete len:203 (-) Transcript_22932:1661-2269(-)
MYTAQQAARWCRSSPLRKRPAPAPPWPASAPRRGGACARKRAAPSCGWPPAPGARASPPAAWRPCAPRATCRHPPWPLLQGWAAHHAAACALRPQPASQQAAAWPAAGAQLLPLRRPPAVHAAAPGGRRSPRWLPAAATATTAPAPAALAGWRAGPEGRGGGGQAGAGTALPAARAGTPPSRWRWTAGCSRPPAVARWAPPP